MDGVQLPSSCRVRSCSISGPKSKVRSMPGGVTCVGSTKNFSETTNNLPMPVAATMSSMDGPKSVMRSPPSMFGSSPVMAGRVPLLPATTGTQLSTSSPQNVAGLSTSSPQNVAGKRITSSKQRDVSVIKLDVSMSPPSHEGLNTSKTEPKSPSSVYESSKCTTREQSQVDFSVLAWLLGSVCHVYLCLPSRTHWLTIVVVLKDC